MDETGPFAEVKAIAKAVGKGNLPSFDAGRLAGMLAEHTYWYVDAETRRGVLEPLAQRAARLSPHDLQLWLLVFKLNSRRATYAGRNREAKNALNGAILRESSERQLADALPNYLKADPAILADEYMRCRAAGNQNATSGCVVEGRVWTYPEGGKRGVRGGKLLGGSAAAQAREDRAFALLAGAANAGRAAVGVGRGRTGSDAAEADVD